MSGAPLWEVPDPKELSLHFAVVDGVLYRGTQKGVCALDAATGELRWDSEIPGVEQASTPRVGGDRILMRDGVFGAFRALDRSDGRTAWVFEEPRAPGGAFPWSTARLYEDAALVFNRQSTLHALRLSDGAPRWQQPRPPKPPGGGHLWENQAPPSVDAEGRIWLAGTAGWTALEWG